MDDLKWTKLGAVAPHDLVSAREELHWAVQIVAAAADALLPRAQDDSHTNLFWSRELGALIGRPLEDERRLGLRFADLTLLAIDGEKITASCSLAGKSLAEGLAWAQRALGSEKALATRDYAMPEHPVDQGGVFGGADGSFAELGRYYASATALLGDLARQEEGATPIAVWPHHFDLGGILFPSAVEGEGEQQEQEQAPQIGFGMSPGDGSIPEPYFYITPWPVPDDADLPPLEGGGVWQTEGFTGALLHGSQLVGRGGSVDEQEASVALYLRVALAASRAVIASQT